MVEEKDRSSSVAIRVHFLGSNRASVMVKTKANQVVAKSKLAGPMIYPEENVATLCCAKELASHKVDLPYASPPLAAGSAATEGLMMADLCIGSDGTIGFGTSRSQSEDYRVLA